MVLSTTSIRVLDAFENSEHQNLLDSIDGLRQHGVGEFVHLPQIVVCGDQSSGKSSVLEAISGVPFPRNDILCTRFATEVRLRRAEVSKVLVSIVPGEDASEDDKTRLLSFKETLTSFEQDFVKLVDRAKVKMGIGMQGTGKAFSKDILLVEISGPDKPKLTLVDLPGLIHSHSSQQSPDDVKLVQELVEKYMGNPRSIILAVVSAKNDHNNQIVLNLARRLDKSGRRTLGLITKPDTLSEGSNSETEFLNLATNRNINLRLGWHVVRNRSYEERESTPEARDQVEATFFQQSLWNDLPRETVGIDALRRRLGRILLDQIRLYLPALETDIRKGIIESTSCLLRLGDSRESPQSQRQFLMKLSDDFQRICREAIDGNYENKFFGSPDKNNEYVKRIRAVVQTLNTSFAERMRAQGHYRVVAETESPCESAEDMDNRWPTEEHHQLVITRKEGLEWVQSLLDRSRGRELPGSFNPMLVKELFRDQSKNWILYANKHVKSIWEAMDEFVNKLLEELTDSVTKKKLIDYYINAEVNARKADACTALERLITDRGRHPITYNHEYCETLKEFRAKRMQKEFEAKLVVHFGTTTIHGKTTQCIAQVLSDQSSTDMIAFACAELLDSMHAYYKVCNIDPPLDLSLKLTT